MPLVRIDLWSGRTPETKAKAAREVIAVLSKTLGGSSILHGSVL